MGLDNYWVRGGINAIEHCVELDFDPPLRLCGGMFSAHGSGSFRGKVYAELVENATGFSLYEDLIDNALVRSMATDLEEYRDLLKEEGRDMDGARGHLDDLVRMFRRYADEGCELISWY